MERGFRLKPVFQIEEIEISQLTPHPRNYRTHPEDQLTHIKVSLTENGFYRNVVIARDNTILAGHGVVIASKQLKIKKVPCLRLPIDPEDPKALKILAGDNEIAHLGEVNDRALADVLKQIHDSQPGIDALIGTGFTPEMLANLVFVTRPQHEIEDFNAAAQWVGMPKYDPVLSPLKVIVSFASKEDRTEFFSRLGYQFTDATKSVWYPHKEDDDVSSLRFEKEELKKEEKVKSKK